MKTAAKITIESINGEPTSTPKPVLSVKADSRDKVTLQFPCGAYRLDFLQLKDAIARIVPD